MQNIDAYVRYDTHTFIQIHTHTHARSHTPDIAVSCHVTHNIAPQPSRHHDDHLSTEPPRHYSNELN